MVTIVAGLLLMAGGAIAAFDLARHREARTVGTRLWPMAVAGLSGGAFLIAVGSWRIVS